MNMGYKVPPKGDIRPTPKEKLHVWDVFRKMTRDSLGCLLVLHSLHGAYGN